MTNVKIAMPENLEEQRKSLVFSAENRPRVELQRITLEQAGTTARRKAARMGSKWLPKLDKYPVAMLGIETLFTGYADERLIDAGLMHIGTVKLRDTNHAACVVPNGTRDRIMVSFDGIGRKGHIIRKIVKQIVKHGLWLVENPWAQGGFAVVFLNKNGKYQSLNGAVQYLNKTGAMEYWLREGSARHFVYYIDSPSGYRQGMIPMIPVPYEAEQEYYIEADEMYNGFYDYMEHVINIATGGMYFVEKVFNAGEELRIDKGIKLVGRQALGVTPSTSLGYLNNLVIYLGDLKSNGVVAGDGNGFEAMEMIQELAMAKFGYPITESEAYKFGGQHRINSFVKGHNQIVKRWAMLAFIKRMYRTGKIKGAILLNRTFEDGVKLAQLMHDKAYEGYVVIIGDLSKVEYFGDTTCVKCSTDLSQPLELRLMDISHTPHGFIPLSKQGMVQMQLAGDSFVDMYKEVAPASVDRIFKHVEFDDVDEMDDSFDTHVDVSSDAYNITTIQRLCPQAMNFDEQIKRIAVQSIVDTMNNRLNRCNLTVAGQYLKLVPDFGRLYDVQLLAEDEFYSPNWKHVEDETGFDAVIIRYPLVDFGAFIKGRAVSKKEMKHRIRALNLDVLDEYAMMALLDSVTSAMVMIASMVEGVTNKLSGADFDGDGVSLQNELAVKKVYVNLDSYSNDFGGSQPGNVYVAFNYDLGPTSFLYAWALDDDNEDRTPNPAIGIVAGYNVTVSSILAMLLSGELAPNKVYHWLLDTYTEDDKGNPMVIPVTPGETPYYRLFTVNGRSDLGVDVSFAGKETTYVEEFELAVRMSDWSLESCIKMLWDLNAVLSKSMNDVIDAAKNGAQVKVPFLEEIGSRVRSSSVATKDYARINMSRAELKIESFVDVCGGEASKEEQQKMTILVNDPIGVMKHRIFELAILRLRRLLKEDVEMDIEEISGGTMLDRSIRQMADFYQDLMKGEGNDKPLAKRQVINMVYAMLKKSGITDPNKILGIVLKASNYTRGDEVPRRYSSFYAQFVEVVRYYVEKFCKDARFTLPVYKFGAGDAYLGQEITFVNGASKDGFYVGKRINGTFCLEADEKGRPIISRNVMDMIPQHEGNDRIAVMRIWKQFFGMGRNRICLDPTFNVEDRIARIENLRERKGFECYAKLYNPDTQQFVEGNLKYIELKTVVAVLVSNVKDKEGLPVPVGFIQIPNGNSVYLEQILNKRYTINNVMKMGKGLETICVVAEEVA